MTEATKRVASLQQEKLKDCSKHQRRSFLIKRKAARKKNCWGKKKVRGVLCKIYQFLLAKLIQYTQSQRQVCVFGKQKGQMSPTILDAYFL